MNNYKKIFDDNELRVSRIISGSKSGYCKSHIGHIIVFNANILTEEDGKIWYGDIDITLDGKTLNKIANEIGKKLYVLREMDYRFENELIEPAIAIKKAFWTTK
jgi:hypothetical protein